MSPIPQLATSSLGDRVSSVLWQDHGPLEAADRLRAGGGYNEREADLVYWSVAVGLAYGIARLDDPCERSESVRERAYDAALVAFDRGDEEVLDRLRARHSAEGDA